MLTRRELTLSSGSFSILEGPAGSQGNAPAVIWSHATGFHAAAYTPLLEALAGEFEVHAPDARGHGETGANSDVSLLTSWQVYYNDLVALIDELPPARTVVLAGHSMGATACVFAAAMRPARVSRLVLVEPVFYAPGTGVKARTGLMASAAKRRSSFASLQEVFDSYRPRTAFRGFSDKWLWDYIDGAFRPSGSGQYELRCSPQWEYRTFETNERWPWWAIARAKAPAIVLFAENYSACPPSARAVLRLLQPRWKQTVLQRTTHLAPMEKPESVFNAIVEAVNSANAKKTRNPA